MYYEISNKVYNHKLTDHEMRHNGPFQKFIGQKGKDKVRQTFFLTKDDPKNLLEVYKAGHCLKPHAFTEDNPSQMRVNCIVLDFDKLTKEQCEFVKERALYGDYSAGMKKRLHDNEGIEGWEPDVWKYKVFHPVSNCLCVYEDIYAKFMEAVKYYNPNKTDEEVERIWRLWKKANNHKGEDGIDNPLFKDWILPDVAMMQSFRTQITYSIDPDNPEKYKVRSDDWMYSHLPTAGFSKYNATDKYDYSGLDWKIGDAVKEVPFKKIGDEHKEGISQIANWIANNCEIQENNFVLPLWKADFARKARRNHFDDLVLGGSKLKRLRAKVFAKIYANHGIDLTLAKDELMKDADMCGKVFARIRGECVFQGISASREDALKDAIKAYREMHGQQIFALLKKKNWKKTFEEVLRQMASSYYSAYLNFKGWRLKERVVMAGLEADQEVLEARNKWRDAIGTDAEEELRTAFFKKREEFATARRDDWNNPKWNQTYDYHRRGFKKEVMETLLNGEIMLTSEDDFIERLRMDIAERDGDYTDDLLKKWYSEYKREWNKAYPDRIIGRCPRKGKWAELFKNRTREEIMTMIRGLDVSKQMKNDLRKRYVKDIEDL